MECEVTVPQTPLQAGTAAVLATGHLPIFLSGRLSSSSQLTEVCPILQSGAVVNSCCPLGQALASRSHVDHVSPCSA